MKLFSIDEYQIQNDLTELQKRIDQLQDKADQRVDDTVPVGSDDGVPEAVQVDDSQVSQGAEQDDVAGQQVGSDEGQQAGADGGQQGGQVDDVPAANTRSKKRCNCCCQSHCKFSFHTMGPNVRAYTSTKVFPSACEMGSFTVDMEALVTDGDTDYMEEEEFLREADTITNMLKSLNLDM